MGLSVVKGSSFLYFIAENLMPLFLYKRRKKRKQSIYRLIQWNVNLVLVYIVEECVYMCLCAGRFRQKSLLGVNREDLSKEAKGKLCVDTREK